MYRLKIVKIQKAMTALCLSVLLCANALALPSEADIELYNQAARGGQVDAEKVAERFNQQISEQGVDALSLIYLGSSQTLMGRDARMPWNKMKHVERGLASIDKGLALLQNANVPLAQQARRQGLPESQLAKAVAATTYSSLPKMFNRLDRGFDLYLALLSDADFTAQPFAARAWIYQKAIAAALQVGDHPQAEKWLESMRAEAPNNPLTAMAAAMLEDA